MAVSRRQVSVYPWILGMRMWQRALAEGEVGAESIDDTVRTVSGS